jgi:nitrate reductase beta subunit
VENFQMLQNRQTADSMASPEDKGARVNLLNWDGKGRPSGLFPPAPDGPGSDTDATASGTPDTSHDGETGPGGTGGLTGGADFK